MSEFKETKWKWEILVQNNYGTLITGENGNKSICTVWEQGFEEHANAKLISCAPEMLEMLEKVLTAKFSCDEIKQLIKKATEL